MIQQINSLAENHTPFLLIVDFEMKHPMVFPIDRLPGDILLQTPTYHSSKDMYTARPGPVKFQSEPVDYNSYARAFRIVTENARAGKTYLANLMF